MNDEIGRYFFDVLLINDMNIHVFNWNQSLYVLSFKTKIICYQLLNLAFHTHPFLSKKARPFIQRHYESSSSTYQERQRLRSSIRINRMKIVIGMKRKSKEKTREVRFCLTRVWSFWMNIPSFMSFSKTRSRPLWS